MDAPSSVIAGFRTAFGDAAAPPRLFFAPGRINVLGEHTDYNGGYVLPGAIDRGTWLAVAPRTDDRFRFASGNRPEVVDVRRPDLEAGRVEGYARYPAGVVWALAQSGVTGPGADCYYWSTLPQEAGLSSSAALTVVTALALTALWHHPLPLERLAHLAQQAENDYVGMPCGIMDQYAVALARPGHLLSLNCDTLAYEHVPGPPDAFRFVVTLSNKPRQLIHSPYAERRRQCEAAVERLARRGWAVPHLAAITPEQLPEALALVEDPVLVRRVRHVVLENRRAQEAVDVLRRGDWAALGALMRASHESLRDDYEVTGPELDTLAEAAWDVPGCLGSRMTGAGFGGATVSLVRKEAVDAFAAFVGPRYAARFGYAPTFLATRLEGGVHEWTEEAS
jgi:galactokinase